ncbi:MAG: undecaprenyldiphospho-muramoylpentapeptide beta-N-acetylglucosaminyltransferase [Coriobacteriia bacterium]|nr:undecaprenyldiphospho-muramoylpentapeptide beta-N-acetylglucosaminyltransferase [Coriobacteriia bacterium]
MRFVITAGGTAGHINPALAVAQELRSLGQEVYFAGTPQGLESKLIPLEGFPYTAFKAAGFNRRKPLTFVSSSAKIAASSQKASKWLKEIKPDAVVGFGGYVSIPVGLAASRLNIPLAIHEQNSASGMANRFLAKRAQLIALTYASAGKDFTNVPENSKTVITGNPVRATLFEISRSNARESFGIYNDATVLLAFGGSLGALHLNEALIAQAETLLEIPGLEVIHVTGNRDYQLVKASLSSAPKAQGRWHPIAYCDRMGEAYAAADVVLSRAGATTVAEIAALAKPALLIPYPHAAADEQTTNARSLVDIGAAEMLADNELDSPVFLEKLTRLLTDESYRTALQISARSLPNAQARADLAQLIMDLV